jgi:hypothetical protein
VATDSYVHELENARDRVVEQRLALRAKGMKEIQPFLELIRELEDGGIISSYYFDFENDSPFCTFIVDDDNEVTLRLAIDTRHNAHAIVLSVDGAADKAGLPLQCPQPPAQSLATSLSEIAQFIGRVQGRFREITL